MDKSYEKKYHSIEENNWWFVGRRDAICRLLSKKNRDLKILDIGCAGGPLIHDLMALGFKNVYGIDFSNEAVEKCKNSGIENVFQMDAHNLEFDDNSFDIIIASDNLEHLENDEKALKNWYSKLKSGGEAYIFVPAFQYLWSEHDVVNHHYRRYTAFELGEKVTKAGFNLEKSCYWNGLMYFPTTMVRLLKRLIQGKKGFNSGKDHLENFNPTFNSILKSIVRTENIFFVSLGLPIGVSAYVKASKS